jgi:hypothetical protein
VLKRFTAHGLVLSLAIGLSIGGLSLPIEAANFLSPQLTSDKPEISVNFSSVSYSNILPVGQIINDSWRQAPQHDADYGFTQNKASLSYRSGHFEWSLNERYDYFIDSNPTTAAIYFLEHNDQQLPANQTYALNLDVLNLQSTGVSVGYLWNNQQFSGKVTVGLWYVDGLRDSYIEADLSTDQNSEISGDVEFNEHYSGSNILKRPNKNSWSTNGWGANVDLDLAWLVNENLTLKLNVDDLFSRFTIDNLGYSEGRATTNNSFINNDGFQSFLPHFRGLEIAKDHHIKIPTTTTLGAVYQGNSFSYIIHAKRQARINFVDLGIGFDLTSSQVTLLIDVKRFTPTIEFRSNSWDLSLTTDRLDAYQAFQFNLNIGYRWQL